jgi:hypothetical protein
VTVVTDILGDAVHNPTTGSKLMPLSALVPFVVVAVIGIVVFCAVYRAGA